MLKTYSCISTKYMFYCYAYKNDAYGNTCVVQVWYDIFLSASAFNANNSCGYCVYYYLLHNMRHDIITVMQNQWLADKSEKLHIKS